MRRKTQLIVALDVDTLDKAKSFVEQLYPQVKIFKVGSQLFTAYGPKAVEAVAEKGAKVFLDLKFHDIPNTVYLAASSGTGLARDVVLMMTVHISEDKAMLESAVKGARERAEELKIKKPFIVGVTVLTSESEGVDTKQVVLKKARLAKEAGLDGVVCSVSEARLVREELGEDFLIITPGIRPQGHQADDQLRTATAQEATEAGADFIVVGRPILNAPNPLKTAEEIIKDLT